MTEGCSSGKKNDTDAATDTVDENDVVDDALVIYSLDPTSGPADGGTLVTVSGRGFEEGMIVRFGLAAAGSVTLVSSSQVTLATPPAIESGLVDVTVVNPDSSSSTLVGGFEYIAEPTPGVGWCNIKHPASTTAEPDAATEPIFGQAWVEGCTGTSGTACAGLGAELGSGAAGTDPTSDPATWTWSAATYNPSFTPAPGEENNDEFMGTLTISEEGTYSYAYRFGRDGETWLYCDLDGSDNGISTGQMGTLSVTSSPSVTIDWCILQHPSSAGTVATVPTEPIYGRVHVAGCTDGTAYCGSVSAQIGFGDPATDPSGAPDDYSWSVAAYNPGHTADDNDEYSASLTPPADGTYSYVVRFSGDGGSTWTYCDIDGTDTGGFSTDQMGTLTVANRTIGWCNLQHPPTSAGTAGVAGEDVFGRVYVSGCTDGAAYCGGLLGQVGFGTVGADPSTFDWTDALYNPGHTADDNDEYIGQITSGGSGSFDYGYRFSGDAGATWTFCDLDGSTDGWDSLDAGKLTVE